MITAALRTGLPLSSLTTKKFMTAVGSLSGARCAAAVPSRHRSNSMLASVAFFISFFISFSILGMPAPFISLDILAGTCPGKKERGKCELRLRRRSLAFCAGGGGELHQITGYSRCIVTRHASLFQVISHHRYHAQGFDGIEIGNDLACALECVLGLEFIR